ncbi:MAG: ABC transporter ATP-binding protein [bacterium]
MLKLFAYLKPYWKAAILAPLFMFVQVFADLMQPTLLAAVIDKGIPAGNVHFIMRTGLQMVGIAVIGMLGGFGGVAAASYAGMHFGAAVRQKLFGKVQEFSFADLDKFTTASLITRLTNDVLQVQMMVFMLLRMLVRAPLLGIGGTIMAVSINGRLASILLLVIPLILLVLTLVIRKGFPLFAAVQEKVDKVNSVLQENLTGIRVVKAFGRTPKENERFRTASKELRDTNVRAMRIMSLSMPLMMLLTNLSIVAIVWFGGSQVQQGEMEVGQIIAFITYMTQILFALRMVSFIFTMISRSKASADRINAVLETEAGVRDAPKAVDKIIKEGRVKFENVSFRYAGAGGAPVLNQITFTAEPGEKVAILGATGAGKSTLVHLIPRLYDPTEGSIRIDGTDIREIRLASLRRQIGVVPQESILFTGSIRDNLLWGKEDATEEEITGAAKAAQVHDFIIRLPDGYSTEIGQKGVNLSGGQKQRLAIARALLKKPAILILDDSTSAVDLGTEARLQKALRELRHGTTCFIIAQRISSVRDADKIIVLEDGRVAASGTHGELLKNSAIYRDIYQSQVREEADEVAGQ